MMVRMPRPARPVDETSKTRYKEVAREALERMKAFFPPGLLESELKKVDETVFAESFAGIGQLLVDDHDAVWVPASSAIPNGDDFAGSARVAAGGYVIVHAGILSGRRPTM